MTRLSISFLLVFMLLATSGFAESGSETVIRKKAEMGNAAAQKDLGLMYYKGKGVPRDYAEAAKWYRKAAEQGLAEAQHGLSVMYRYGEGVPRNDAAAGEWCRKAAEQGYAGAQFNLGLSYFN